MKKRNITILAIIFILLCNICQAVSIQKEIAKIEKKAIEYENIINNSTSQMDMNINSGDLYILWDNELNSLWKRLIKKVDIEEKRKLLIQQREWIKRKERNIKEAGAIYEGGSIQSYIHNRRATEMTRARVYTLAKYLAHVRKESFVIPKEIKKSLDYADPSLNDVFKFFEGCWEIDEEKGKYIGIERSDMCFYGVEGSNWTLWVSDEVVLSDLDVYSYAQDTIIFKVSKKGKNTFYKLSTDIGYTMIFEWGGSLDKIDDVISSCDFIKK